ncbi:MAG: leucine-rich repeat domain-containing protein [Bacteroidetes bacterium]|nr:leucine-rich repeat domain-containing protein [Bacteroidota bacterium]
MLKFLSGILIWFNLFSDVFCQTSEFRDEPLYTDLKIALEHPERVKRLALNRKKIKRIPKEVFTFPNLWELDLSKNKIASLPPEISKLKKLRILNLERNNLEALPKELCDLQKLEVLNLRKNALYQLPDCLTDLSQLNYFIVSSNPIFKLPKNINGMVQLIEFDARSTDIHPDAIKSMQQALPASRILWDSDCNCGPNH